MSSQRLTDKVEIRYLGPAEFYGPMKVIADVYNPAGAMYTFIRGETVTVPAKLAEELMGLNSRGCTLETANDYGCQLFEIVGDGTKIKPAPKTTVKGGEV